MIIPAFNERENVAPLLAAVGAAFDRHALAGEIVFVDDGSIDGTAQAAADALATLNLPTRLCRHARNLGQLLIIAMSWGRLPHQARRAVIQAWHDGKKTRQNFQRLDYEALLARPLAEVRRELNIAEPARYREIMP